MKNKISTDSQSRLITQSHSWSWLKISYCLLWIGLEFSGKELRIALAAFSIIFFGKLVFFFVISPSVHQENHRIHLKWWQQYATYFKISNAGNEIGRKSQKKWFDFRIDFYRNKMIFSWKIKSCMHHKRFRS